jgi:cell division transport system permease protein
MAFLRYAIVRALRNMRGTLFTNLGTIGIIAITALIFSSLSLIAFNLVSFLRVWEDKIEVIAYLRKGTPASEVEDVLGKTRALEGVESVKYFSPADAMAFMEAKLGSQKGLLEGTQAGVLPGSIEIQMKRDYRNFTRVKEVASRLKQFPQFEEVQYGREWVETFSTLVTIFQITCSVLGLFLLVSMIFIVSNTLQLAIASRREEIEIMRIVGASPPYIRAPFYVEGMIQGLLGAGLAMGLLFLMHRIILLYLPSTLQVWLAKIPVLFLPPEMIGGILGGGIVLGFVGSFIASMRLLKQRW